MIDLLNGYSATAAFTAQDIRPARIGYLGEQAIIRLAIKSGYLAGKAPTFKGDVFVIRRIGTVDVTEHMEVKTAKADRRGYFQFCLNRTIAGRVCTDCHNADTVILLAVNANFQVTMYVIPTGDIGAQKKICISNPGSPNGKYSKYIQAVL